MSVVDVCSELCIGCGLCKTELHTEMVESEKGFVRPVFEVNAITENFLKNICPINASMGEQMYSVWGMSKGVYAAWAKDDSLRKKASSGGVLTSLAIYLLENHYVDGIIHVVADEKNPTETRCCISTTRDAIERGCGSRYAISSPWMNLSEMLDSDKRYVAIGKPCDIKGLRKLKETDEKYNCIKLLLSFFCAGMPSRQANEQLLQKLGCTKEECESLTYRGNGWPGYTTALDKNGKEYTMEYSEAWGGILGRDVHPFCRMCFDGIGEAADIACGDGWYISENAEPDFSERDGRNVVFVRTDIGNEVYQAAVDAGTLVSTEWERISQLEIIQKYQFTRRTTMKDRLRAYRILGRNVPLYDKKKMTILGKNSNLKVRLKIFLGTAKRILLKKI